MNDEKNNNEMDVLEINSQEESYIDFKIFFSTALEENKDIIFEHFSEGFINKIILFGGERTQKEATRQLRIYLNIENLELKNLTTEDSLMSKLSENDLKKIKDRFEELLIKLVLYTKVTIVKYNILGCKISRTGMERVIFSIETKVNNFKKLELNEIDLKIEINFNKNREKYKQIIEVLKLIPSDPVICFLVLYDLLLLWASQKEGNNPRQKNIINYVDENISELKQYDDKFKIIKIKEKKEDSLTNLRNDIGHSGERLKPNEAEKLKNRAQEYIQPLIYLICRYIFNCKG